MASRCECDDKLVSCTDCGDIIDRPRNSFNFGRLKISGLFIEVDDSCALIGYYAMSNCNFLPTFRDNVLVQADWTVGCPEMVGSYHYWLRSNPEERS